MNSRHPGPRREEGESRAVGHMPLPLDWGDPRHPGDPGDPRENSGRLDSMRRRVQIDTFVRRHGSNNEFTAIFQDIPPFFELASSL